MNKLNSTDTGNYVLENNLQVHNDLFNTSVIAKLIEI